MVTEQLIRFARSLRYEDLPAPVVLAAKRYILDALGCAVAGHHTDKGKIAAAMSSALGGAPEARILGTNQRVAVTNAAFANGELTNGLDYDGIPHIQPVIVPPILAMAEKYHSSGKSFILAVVVAHEISARLGVAAMRKGVMAVGAKVRIWGLCDESIIGAAAGLSSLLSLDEDATNFAIGLAGYYCPPQSSHHWETQSPLSMVKYTPVGWICQGAVTAALLAQAGFTGPSAVFDGPVGFPVFYGWEEWKPAVATAELGEKWRIEMIDLKPYACCRFLHSQLDCMTALVAKHRFAPDRIQSITALGVPLPANPDKMNVRNQVDAQFSTPYMLALAASGIPIDAMSQTHERLNDPTIRSLMRKISWGEHPQAAASKQADPKSYIAKVEVVVDGKSYVEERLYARGTASVAGFGLTDDELDQKFIANVSSVLPTAGPRARDMLRDLDKSDDVSNLVDSLTL